MTWWEAIILGLVEGLTEYLPVSSTGHLLVVQAMLGIGTESYEANQAANAYAMCIQAGAIVAVLGLYFKRVRQVFSGFAGKDPDGLRLFVNMMAGFLPAAVIGVLLNDHIKAYLFGPWPVVIAWIVGGVIILAVSFYRRNREGEKGKGKTLEELTWQMALIIGFAQCIAMWPGTSRSLITIVFGVIVGMRLVAAVEFSFLLGVITLGGATVYDGIKHGDLMLQEYGPLEMGIGFVAAFVSAVVAVKWMVAYLNKHGMEVFGYYRIAIGIIVGALLLTNVLVVPVHEAEASTGDASSSAYTLTEDAAGDRVMQTAYWAETLERNSGNIKLMFEPPDEQGITLRAVNDMPTHVATVTWLRVDTAGRVYEQQWDDAGEIVWRSID